MDGALAYCSCDRGACHPFGKRCGITRAQAGEDGSSGCGDVDARIPGMVARWAGALRDGGDPDDGGGGCEAPEPRARVPCQRALTHHQSHEECARPSRGPGIQATSAQGLAGLRTAEGTGLPMAIIEEFRLDMARLALVREQISSIEKTRAERLERAPDTGPHAMVRLLARVIGIGIETADMLVREILSRKLRDRRAV